MASHTIRHAALFMAGFSSGGVPRVVLNLAEGLREVVDRVDLVTVRGSGPLAHAVPRGVRHTVLRAGGDRPPRLHGKREVLWSAGRFGGYLRRETPDVVLSAGNYVNCSAVAGRRLARRPVPIVVSHHAQLAVEAAHKPFVRWGVRHLYPRADRVVAVSRGVAEDLEQSGGLDGAQVTTIYNPVVRNDFSERMRAPVDHPWLTRKTWPVILGMGRLHPQKDFPTLLRAFARVRRERPARLLLLGESKTSGARAALQNLARRLGVSGDVSIPGFVPDPLPYFARSDLFALSSAWEGFGNVLVEAMACGCPVVSTDCPSGPAEILAAGRYGPLVPVGDDVALAAAMLERLARDPERDALARRAEHFSVARSAKSYLEVFESVVAGGGARVADAGVAPGG